MTTNTLGEDFIPVLAQLTTVLERELHPVRQQQLIELLAARHAMKVGNEFDACGVIDAMAKHCKQMITNNIHMIVEGKHRS